MFKFVFIFLFIGLAAPASASRFHNSFQQFLPGVGQELQDILNTKCWSQYQSYRHESIAVYGTQCVKTYSCIMAEVSEYTKANMQASAVLLGLTPWIVSVLGSSLSEISLIAARRPCLTFLLVVGSPAIMPTRSSAFRNPFDEYLKHGHGQKLLPKLSPVRHGVCLVVEMVFAIVNVVNIATLSRQLALTAIPVMSCDSDQLVGMWAALVVITHFLGLAAFFIRVILPPPEILMISRWSRVEYWFRSRWGLIAEFQHGANQEPLNLKWRDESWTILGISWLTATYTVVHSAFGTLVLSSLSFVGIEDATKIAARFMVSAIISRIIVAYGLAGMRSAHEHGEKTDGEVIEMRTVPTPTEMETNPSDLERGECKVQVQLSESLARPEYRPARQGSVNEDGK